MNKESKATDTMIDEIINIVQVHCEETSAGCQITSSEELIKVKNYIKTVLSALSNTKEPETNRFRPLEKEIQRLRNEYESVSKILAKSNRENEGQTTRYKEWITKQDTEISILKKEISDALNVIEDYKEANSNKKLCLAEKDKLLSEANLKIRELEAFSMADKIIAKSEIDKAKEVISELCKQAYDIHEHCIDMGYMDNEDLTEGQEMLQSAIKNGTEFISSITKDKDNG